MIYTINGLMKLKKHELCALLINERERADIEFDRAENAIQELDEVETHEDEFLELEEIKDLINRIKTEKERSSWGVSLARETEAELTQKLLDYV